MRERQFTATVTHQTPTPGGEDSFQAITKAKTEIEAARNIADLAAERKFGEQGISAYLVETNDGFRAFIGVPIKRKRNGNMVTRGTTVNIHIKSV